MADAGLLELEAKIKKIGGVLGCVILMKPDGSSGEVQAFARLGSDLEDLRAAILERVETSGLNEIVREIRVFELEAESLFGDRQTLERAAELAEQEARARGLREVVAEPESPGEISLREARWRPRRGLDRRPLLQRVVLSATTGTSEAEVALGGPGAEVVGVASGAKSAHALSVVAQATIDACGRLVEDFQAEVRGASLMRVVGKDAVVVLVRLDGDLDLIGSALLRGSSSSEATVRATLDAVNRLLLRRA